MQGPDAIVGMTLFISTASVFVLRGPLGRALADRIAGRTGRDEEDLRALHAEMDDMRARLAETEERLDFAERLLSNQREPEQLPHAPKNS